MLQTHLGARFVDSDWQPALTAVMNAEGDADKALSVIDDLCKSASSRSGLKIRIPAKPSVLSKAYQAVSVEAELLDNISALKARNRIFGPMPSIDEILDPIEERQQEDTKTDGSVKAIAELVQKEADEADRAVEEVDDSDDGDDEGPLVPSRAELIMLCQQIELGCMHYGDPQFSLDLSHQLFKFRGILRREELKYTTQTTLDRFFA